MNIFFLSVMRIDPALAQQDRVEALVQTPSSHSHGITAMVFFSGECRGSVTPPTPCKSELHRAQGMWKGPGLYCDSSPSLYHDQYSWILLLKEAFLPSGGKWRVQAKTIQCHSFASNMYVAFLFAKPCILVFGWKHSVGMLNSGRQRMAHLGGMHNPSSSFSLCSSILEFWMQGGSERSWKGKKGNRVWKWTETRGENLVGWGLPEILCLDRQMSLLRNVDENIMASIWWST